MKREFIEKLLKEHGLEGDAVKGTVDGILDENGRDIEAEKAKTTAKDGELATANTTIEGLRETMEKYDGKDPVKLQSDLDDLQQKYKDDVKAAQLAAENLKKEFGVKDALKAAGVVDPEYLIFKHGGIEKFAFSTEGALIGLDDTLKPYKDSSPHLFAAAKETGKPGYNPKGGEATVTSRAAAIAAEKNKQGQANPYVDAWAQK